MKIRNLTVIFFIAIFAMNAHSQNEYVLVGDYQESLKDVYEVRKKTIKTHRYEYKEIDNPEYMKLTLQIDSLKKEKIIVTALTNAKKYLSAGINNKSGSKSEKLAVFKRAKQYLDQTGLPFEQNTEGKYKVVIEQAKTNIVKIDKLSLNYNSLSELNDEIRKHEKTLRNPGGHFPMKAKIFDYVPVEKIEREIFYIDSTHSIEAVNEILLPFENTFFYEEGYKFVSKDFCGLVKGELISKIELKKENPRNERGVADPISYTGNVIFKGKESGKKYFSSKAFWKEFAKDKEFNEVYAFLEKSGGKLYEEGGKYKYKGTTYVEHNGHKCKLTGIVFESLLKKDITIISKMSSSVAEHKKMKDQASVLANEMGNYYSAYKSKLITLSERNKWKVTTIKCDNLLIKMRKLPYATEREYYTQISDEDKEGNKLADIVDMVTLSKQKLGI